MIASSTVPCLETKPGITHFEKFVFIERIFEGSRFAPKGMKHENNCRRPDDSSVCFPRESAVKIKCRIQSHSLFFAGLVVLAGEFHPIPFRTRPLKPPAPMVLRLKPRESRSLPVLPRTASWKRRPRKRNAQHPANTFEKPRAQKCSRGFLLSEGSVPDTQKPRCRCRPAGPLLSGSRRPPGDSPRGPEGCKPYSCWRSSVRRGPDD